MGGLGFINPWLLAGAAAAILPVLIHLLYRRRARIIRFSAMRFVMLSYKKVARKLLLREYLLLAARCLLLAALAVALARPILSRLVQGMAAREGPTATALIIDNSYSMLSRAESDTMFDRARELARDLIRSMSDVDEAAVLFTSPGYSAEPLEVGLTGDERRLLDAVGRVEIAYGASRPIEAVHRASLMMQGASQPNKQIVVITDLQRYGWQEAQTIFSEAAPPIFIFDMTDGVEVENLAVGDLSLETVPVLREARLKLEARVKNFGGRESQSQLVQVLLGDNVEGKGFVTVAGRGVETKEFFLAGREEKTAEGVVEILGSDPLAVDDRAYFHLAEGGRVRALVVDGDPKTELRQSETYFLDKALNPMLYHKSMIDPKTIVTEELEDYPIDDFHALVLCNVDKVSQKTAARIREFVRNGGGLLFTLGDQVEADFYNSLWKDLLPRELRGIKSQYAGAEAQKDIRTMHVDRHFGGGAQGEDVHPILAVFRDPGEGDLGLGKFTTYFLLQPEVVPTSHVVLRLTDGTPLMVEKSYGRGIVIVYASSADLAWSDLCLYPTFLPLFQQTVQYLAMALRRGDPGELTAGSMVVVGCPRDKEGAIVTGPDRRTSSVRAMEDKGQRIIKVQTNRPGFYYIKFLERMSPAGALAFEARDADQVLVLNLDLRESDLAKISEGELKKLVPAESLTVVHPGQDLGSASVARRVDTTWDTQILLLVIMLLAAELLLVRKG